MANGTAFILLSIIFAATADISIDSADIECELKKVAYQYALKQLPERAKHTNLVEVFDALELGNECNLTRPASNVLPPPSYPLPAQNVIFVDCSKGSESGNGSESNPFATVEAGLAHVRQIAASQRTLVLRSGICFLDETINLSAEDSGLTITNYPGEAAWLSGGVPLPDLSWQKHNVTDTANVWKAVLTPEQAASLHEGTITGLMTLQSHERLTRARYPNGVLETRDYDNIAGSNVLKWIVPSKKLPAAVQVLVNATTTVGYDSSTMVEYNTYASGTCKSLHDPNCPCGAWSDVKDGVWTSWSYWCSNQSAGGWSEMDRGNGYWNGPTLPEGMAYNTSMAAETSRFQRYSNATGGFVFAWRAQGWFVNMFEIDSHDREKGVINWSKGGFQGGRGWQVNGTDGSINPSPPFFIENVFEELDYPSEWFYNTSTRTLYLYWNATAGTAPSETLVATRVKRLINVQGNLSSPVRDVTVQGLGLRDARYTYMEPWGVPSGGDWALHRGGSVFIERTVNTTVRGCLFKRVDGNAVFVSGYNRNTSVTDNEFVWIGDSAMAAWGYSEDQDGTNGDQPRGVVLARNYAHELGVFQLQSSMWFQAKTAQTTIESNIFFNGPRAGINLNDHFGGGNVIRNNTIFNTCRQSGDHGPINTWERQLYWTDVRYGSDKPSFTPLPTLIEGNYIHATYGGSQGVDNDGSSWYHLRNNVIYGEGLKQDYGGHDSMYENNLNVVHKYDGQNCINVGSFRNGEGPCVNNETTSDCSHSHIFRNNRCIVLYTEAYGTSWACNDRDIPSSREGMPVLYGNAYFTPLGNASLKCGGNGQLLNLTTLQAAQVEQGSTSAPLPSTATIIQWAKAKLGL